jgi:thioesterase domain-containing protein
MLEPNFSSHPPWVFPFRNLGTKPPLFCVCAGGGDVFDYQDLAQALPADQPIYAFGLPELGEDMQFPTVEQLAAIYLQKVRELQKRGPYQFGGHSFGGLVIYEMATQLAEQGEEVSLLALIDTLHPRFSQNLPAWQKTLFHLTYFSDRLVKYARNILAFRIDKIVSDVLQFGRYKAQHLVSKVSRVVFGKEGRTIPNRIRSDALILAAAWRRYIPKPYYGRVVLLNATERTSEYRTDRTLGWKTCAKGAVVLHILPGDHYTIMHPPHVQALIEQLKPYLTTGASSEPSSKGAIRCR